MFKNLLSILVLAASLPAFANYGMGVVSRPFEMKKKMVSAEFAGVFNNGSGAGMQARYRQEINEKVNFDAGIGAAGGERASRFFIGADIEMFPDYGNQPRISTRTSITRASEFNQTHTILGIAPTVSKGLSFWGQEAYPFVAIPLGLNLGEQNTYQTQAALSAGMAMNLPIEGYNNLIANVEMNVNLKDSYNGLFAGLTYPFE